ncbi:uncharacterized protein EAF02_010636 [Botrytis sinoallii]|uniref:uncharacterized protein n=1 Tax=Botrytis sinoallii TaxID=1463999 RepID=UPI001901B874|nr:uncharacterized protein EAF02_010636 [Botrytis sinoallii]KAF7861682.1 hypothetical protein EAF02_010636 [Botrytis sinoallii]
MFHKIKNPFRNRASGRRPSEDGVPLLTMSEQLRSSVQIAHQPNWNASPRRQNDRDSRNLPSVQEIRVPQTPQHAPLSPHHSSLDNQHTRSRSIQSNENGRPSTSTRAESVVSRSSSHHTTSTNMNPRVVVPQSGSSRSELRLSSASRVKPRSSILRSIFIERPSNKSR